MFSFTIYNEIWKGACIQPSRTRSSKSTKQIVERIVRNMFSMCYFKFNMLKFDNFFSFILGFSY